MRPQVVCLLTGGYGIRPYGFCFYLLSIIFYFFLFYRQTCLRRHARGPVALVFQGAEALAQVVGAGAVYKGDAAVFHPQVDRVQAGVNVIFGVFMQINALLDLQVAVAQHRRAARAAVAGYDGLTEELEFDREP